MGEGEGRGGGARYGRGRGAEKRGEERRGGEGRRNTEHGIDLRLIRVKILVSIPDNQGNNVLGG